MTVVIWSKRARRELDLIWEWVARHDLEAADRIIDAVDDRVALLCSFPEIGSPAAHGTRKLSLGPYSYVLRYTVTQGVIRILGVQHMAQGR